jgi:hypothetical protein
MFKLHYNQEFFPHTAILDVSGRQYSALPSVPVEHYRPVSSGLRNASDFDYQSLGVDKVLSAEYEERVSGFRFNPEHWTRGRNRSAITTPGKSPGTQT